MLCLLVTFTISTISTCQYVQRFIGVFVQQLTCTQTTILIQRCFCAGLLLPPFPAACTIIVASLQQSLGNCLGKRAPMIATLAGQVLTMWGVLVRSCSGQHAPFSSDTFVATLPSVASLAMALLCSRRQLYHRLDSLTRSTENIWKAVDTMTVFLCAQVCMRQDCASVRQTHGLNYVQCKDKHCYSALHVDVYIFFYKSYWQG